MTPNLASCETSTRVEPSSLLMDTHFIYFSASVNYSMTEEAGTRQIRNATHFAIDLLSWVMVKKFNSVMAPFTLSIEMVDISPISSFSFFIGPVMQYDHQSRSLWSMCFDGIVFVKFHK